MVATLALGKGLDYDLIKSLSGLARIRTLWSNCRATNDSEIEPNGLPYNR